MVAILKARNAMGVAFFYAKSRGGCIFKNRFLAYFVGAFFILFNFSGD